MLSHLLPFESTKLARIGENFDYVVYRIATSDGLLHLIRGRVFEAQLHLFFENILQKTSFLHQVESWRNFETINQIAKKRKFLSQEIHCDKNSGKISKKLSAGKARFVQGFEASTIKLIICCNSALLFYRRD